MAQAKKIPQFAAGVSACLGAVGTGIMIGWTSNIGDQMKAGNLNGLQIKDVEMGWIASTTALGAMTTCFITGILCNLIGRKITMLITIVPFTIGWLLVIFAEHVAMIFVGRFLIGLGGGAFCIAAPLYTSEIADTAVRGILGTFFQLLLTVGILYDGVAGMLFYYIRDFTITCAAFPILFGIVFVFMPETPVYYLKKNNPEKAKQSLAWLRGKNFDSSAEMKEMETQIERDKSYEGQFWKSMSTKPAIRATLICFGLMFYQQLSGINAVMFYASSMFKDAQVKEREEVCTIIIFVVQVVATFCASLTIDKVGRKILLMTSSLFMALGTILVAVSMSLRDLKYAKTEDIGFLPIVGLVIFIIAFSIGYGPIPWLASSELFPPQIKNICSGAAGTFNWFLAFLVGISYFPLRGAIGGGATLYIFSGISASGIPFVYFLMPETKGKSFAEIQSELGG